VPLSKLATFGSAGSGAGQLSEPDGVAVDQTTGDVYVADTGNHRVDKFDAQGNFILTFGREVDQTTGGNVCTAASGDTCQAGAALAGSEGQLEAPAFVAVDNSGGPSAGDVYVGDTHPFDITPEKRGVFISKFDSSGNFISVNEGRTTYHNLIQFPLAGIAVDPTGNLWVYAFAEVYEFSQGGTLLQIWFDTFGGGTVVTDTAVDGSHVFVINDSRRVVRLSTLGVRQGVVNSLNGSATALAIDPATDDLYVENAGATIEHYTPRASRPPGYPNGRQATAVSRSTPSGRAI
jgi:DNA-binding beta-propeller fold protein YncE